MPTEDTTMFDQVAEVIERLRPFLLRDGGDCSLIDVETVLLNYNYMVHVVHAQVLQSLLKLVLSVHYTKKCLV